MTPVLNLYVAHLMQMGKFLYTFLCVFISDKKNVCVFVKYVCAMCFLNC